ncbi:MAG: hypothetical protein EAZ89_09835 [Bacteroidetes bacterium]|nr:MAG: hypothetical protein EAZ89_09835 [Bacteroidota bacterium]
MAFAQPVGDYTGDPSAFYAQTKQLNQFIRRFNGEEALGGNRFYPGNALYHDRNLRKGYLETLFDLSNPELTPSLRNSFTQQALDKPFFLDFHGGNWFAEVHATVLYQGKEEDITLFMKLEEEKVGSEWVFFDVYFAPFDKLFASPDPEGLQPAFLHPLSHELDFMNLSKIFRNQQYLESYAAREFRPDHFTLFLWEAKRKALTFKGVNEVKFHFFQMDGWYIEVSEFNREGRNRGWLISQALPLESGQSDLLTRFILRK